MNQSCRQTIKARRALHRMALTGTAGVGAVLREHNAETPNPFPGEMRISQHVGNQRAELIFRGGFRLDINGAA
jgi:hypothetical protein